jgi:hypothetical protein
MRNFFLFRFIDVYGKFEKKDFEKKNLIDKACDEMLKKGLLVRKKVKFKY